MAKNNPKIPAQFAAAEKDTIPYDIILGEDELKNGKVLVKEQRWEMKDGKKVKIPSDDKGVEVNRADLVKWLKDTQTYRDFCSGNWS